MNVQNESQRNRVYEAEERWKKKEVLSEKVLERKRWNWVMVLVVLLLLILMRWLLRRGRRWNL